MTLSPSRIDTYFKCSYLYYLKYILKIPDEQTAAMARGSFMHAILEYLLRQDRRGRVERIIQKNDLCSDPAVARLVRVLAKKYKVWNPSDVETVKEFVLRGLKQDFYHDGSSFLRAEYKFELAGEGWNAVGIIDKMAGYPDRIVITDYKSSKSKFTAKQLEFNLQNYFYTYASKKMFPDLPVCVEFQFLKFKKVPLQAAPVLTDEQLKGFEEWLPHISKFLENLTLEQALESPAKDDIEKRMICCGSSFGSVNKDGGKAHMCGYRYPYIYFELLEGDKVIKKSKNKNELVVLMNSDRKIIEKQHDGCPFFKYEYQ